LVSAGRGRYGLGSRGGTLHTLVRSWAKAEASLKPWQGGWLTVLVGHLARSNKTRRRGNERALGLFGFAEVRTGLWVRPANLRRTLSALREDLVELGLDPDAICLDADQLAPETAVDAQTLWDTPALATRYRQNVERLAESTERLTTLDEDASARETLLVGRQVTRDILLDPLLPEPLVDVVARRAMIDAMRSYDQLGKAYWRRFFKREESA
ncbi:MAG: PaaX family transcriptional regulator C-terminal domain-containing protein, partial [Pseudomonadota bacterium]